MIRVRAALPAALAWALSAVLIAASCLDATPASADTSRQVQGQADAVLAKVRALQAQAATVTKAYDRALGGLAGAVNQSVLTAEQLQAAQAAAAAAQAQLDDRVRGLYMDGGSAALAAGVFGASDLSDLMSRVAMVQHVVSADRLTALAQSRAVSPAAAIAAASARNAHRAVHTAREVAQVADRLAAILAEQQALLDSLTARVKTLKAAEDAAAALAAERAQAAGVTAQRISQLRPQAPPAVFFALYHSAAKTCPGLSWTVLAAIGQVETGHGQNVATSYAGAMGPMQFLPSTFASYGVDGNHDGKLDIMNPADSVYTAAAYLCANAAGTGPEGLHNAIWNYNHAEWYVQMVLTLARQFH